MGEVERQSHDLARNLEVNRHEFAGVAGHCTPAAFVAAAFINAKCGARSYRQV